MSTYYIIIYITYYTYHMPYILAIHIVCNLRAIATCNLRDGGRTGSATRTDR